MENPLKDHRFLPLLKEITNKQEKIHVVFDHEQEIKSRLG